MTSSRLITAVRYKHVAGLTWLLLLDRLPSPWDWGEGMSERKNIKMARHLALLEAARQGSHNLSISLDSVNPLQLEQIGWDFYTTNDDVRVRALLKAFYYIEKLKFELEVTPKEDWCVFGKLDANELRVQALDANINLRRIKPATSMGRHFLNAINTINKVNVFPSNYEVHPYIDFFKTGDCQEIYLAYHNELTFRFPPAGRRQIDVPHPDFIDACVIEAQRVAEIIDINFPRIMNEMLDVARNKKIRTFELKSNRHDDVFRDFVKIATKEQERVSFIVKLTLGFVGLGYKASSSSKQDVNQLVEEKYIECFGQALTKLNEKIKATKRHEGFVAGLHVIKFPMNEALHSQGYLAMSYERNQCCFDRDSLLLWQRFDEGVFDRLRHYAGVRGKNNVKTLAKRLNEAALVDPGLAKLASFLESENPLVKTKALGDGKNNVNNPWVMNKNKKALLAKFIDNHQRVRLLSFLMWIRTTWINVVNDDLNGINWGAMGGTGVEINDTSLDVKLNHLLKSDNKTVKTIIAPPNLLKKKRRRGVEVIVKRQRYKSQSPIKRYSFLWNERREYRKRTRGFRYAPLAYVTYLESLDASVLSEGRGSRVQIGIPDYDDVCTRWAELVWHRCCL